MSYWTVDCFCGTVYLTPPDRCPTCDTPLPDVGGNDPIEQATPHVVAGIPAATVRSRGDNPRQGSE